MMAMDQKENGWRPDDGDKGELAEKVARLLGSKSEMLDDYFSLQIDRESGKLLGIPLLLGNYLLDRKFFFL